MLLPTLKTNHPRHPAHTAVTRRPWHVVASHALNLNIERKQIDEATMVTSATHYRVGRLFDAQIRWLAHNRRPVGFAGLPYTLPPSAPWQTSALPTHRRTGGVQAARVRLDRDIPLPPGFRFVLRGQRHPVAGAIVGGGQRFWTRTHNKNRACIGSKTR